MAKEIELYQIDAFTTEAFHGNPAGVTLIDSLSENEKQLIAREMNLSETAFISKSDKADYKLQWFTPTKEVQLCGHATIASLHFLSQTGLVSDRQEIKFDTLSGIIKCFVKENKYYMQIPIPELSEFNGNKEEILNAIGIGKQSQSELPFLLLDNGYLFISVNSIKDLWNINPNFKELKKLSETKKEFFDIAVFTTDTIEKSSSAHLRFFAPFHGIDEDPVTGSACGPLLQVLLKLGLLKNYTDKKEIIFEQGDVLNRKGRVTVKLDQHINELYISGNAVTIFKGKLFL
jgi:trans-2,3-dihydro-3-hydroxyanthranilate isomerase